MPTINQRIDWLHKSSGRLIRGINLPKGDNRLRFLRRESWVHLKRAFELWFTLRFRGKVDGEIERLADEITRGIYPR